VNNGGLLTEKHPSAERGPYRHDMPGVLFNLIGAPNVTAVRELLTTEREIEA
jgi:hypothetical protein